MPRCVICVVILLYWTAIAQDFRLNDEKKTEVTADATVVAYRKKNEVHQLKLFWEDGRAQWVKQAELENMFKAMRERGAANADSGRTNRSATQD